MTDTLRIGLYTPNYPGVSGEGGIGTYTKMQAHELTELGHEVHILVPGVNQSTTNEGKVNIHFTGKDPFTVIDRFLPGSARAMNIHRHARQLTKRHKLDIFEFTNWEGMGVGF